MLYQIKVIFQCSYTVQTICTLAKLTHKCHFLQHEADQVGVLLLFLDGMLVHRRTFQNPLVEHMSNNYSVRQRHVGLIFVLRFKQKTFKVQCIQGLFSLDSISRPQHILVPRAPVSFGHVVGDVATFKKNRVALGKRMPYDLIRRYERTLVTSGNPRRTPKFYTNTSKGFLSLLSPEFTDTRTLHRRG